MRKEYDFRNAKPNPYAKRLKRSVTIRLDESTIRCFHGGGRARGPYQTLINVYLRDCAVTERRPGQGRGITNAAADERS